MKQLALFLITICSSFTFAQNSCHASNGSATRNQNINLSSSVLHGVDDAALEPGITINFNGVKTSALATKEFAPARVSLGDKSIIMLARLNIISNNLEIKDQNNNVFELKKKEGATLTFINSNEVYKSISYVDEKGNENIDYFLSEANSNLLKKVSYKYIEAKKAKSSYTKDKPASFKKSIKYFYKNSNDYLVNLSSRKKNIIKNFNGNHEILSTFLKKNKIDLKNENDLLKLVGFMNKSEIGSTNTSSIIASNRRSVISVSKEK